MKLATLMVMFERKIDAFISGEVPWIGRKPEQKGENRVGTFRNDDAHPKHPICDSLGGQTYSSLVQH